MTSVGYEKSKTERKNITEFSLVGLVFNTVKNDSNQMLNIF